MLCKATEHIGEQIELIEGLHHKTKTGSRFESALAKLIAIDTGEIVGKDLTGEQIAALRVWRLEYLDDLKLPNAFVKESAKTVSKAKNAWIEAKQKNNYATFAPHLKKVVEQARKKADYLGYKEHPYDALLGIHEPGMTARRLRELFAELKPFLTQMTSRLSNRKVDTSCLRGPYPLEKQEKFCHFILKTIGVDPDSTRLDMSEHPFCIGLHPHDVRITMHASTTNLFMAPSAVLHEGGHALYDLGLPAEHFGSPLAECSSIGIHESQSRFFETYIGQGLPFWKHAYPELQKTFPSQLGNTPLDTFYEAINDVRPSLIRVFSDEVSYILHVILRFEIELGFLEGSIDVDDLPRIWNEKMEESLGITPPTDAEGCLQDVHWSCGYFGYFPTYALGNIYAGQIFVALKKALPDWAEHVAQGNLAPIVTYLRENIHKHGHRYSALELIERLSGDTLTSKPYMDYLTEKYR